MHIKELENLLNKTANERADIALHRISDSETIWFIIDDESYFLPTTHDGLPSLPIWSDFELAQHYLSAIKLDGDWKIISAELEDFLLNDIAVFIENRISITLQAIHQQSNAVCSALQFAEMINEICLENYGEHFDLPYLP